MGRRQRHNPPPPTGPSARPGARALLAAPALAAAIALTLALGTVRSGAETIDGLNAKISGAREQAQALGAEIDAASAELASAQAQAIAAARREAELNAVLAEGEAREAQLEAAVTEARTELAAARARLQRSLDVLADRLVAIYRDGMPDTTTVLLESDGFDDLATRAEYLRRIEEADASLVARVRSLRDQVAVQLAAVEVAERRAEAYNERVAAARDEIASVRANAQAQAAALAAARARREAALEGLQTRVSEWTSEVQRLERISAREAEQEVGDWLGDWAIPESVVMCESGGNWEALNPTSGAGGAYQILPSTWELYGGEGDPEDASPAEQSEIAAQIWADSGAAAWACAR
jgi:septal ring factor EnvC (AmiA/AmiB activator)